MKAGPARLLFPAIRWSDDSGFDEYASTIEHGLRNGVGGFILFGGEADAVTALTYQTQSRCDYALLFGSDLERGAGQQFKGTTPLPPAAALASLDDTDITRRAALTTASDARRVGVNWAFAPVADIDAEPRNPIVGTRSFGTIPSKAAAQVAAWVTGCHEGGALACAKHFPGHGRTTEDSHATLPHVTLSRRQILDEMEPFRAAIEHGVDAIMTAHVVYDDIDTRFPATLSSTIINDILRRELRFQGLVVTDGMGMQGILDACDGSEPMAAIAAVNAGCDVLLYPTDAALLADVLRVEVGRRLDTRRVDQSIERIAEAADRAQQNAVIREHTGDKAWALDIAYRSVQQLGDAVVLPREIDVLTVDDDLGGPHEPPARDTFPNALEGWGFEVRRVERADEQRPLVIAVYADIRAWKGRPGLSANAVEQIRNASRARSDASVVLFAHPRLHDAIESRRVVAAWGGEAIMQEAAAMWLAQSSGRR